MKTFDVAIVGGGIAGYSAALTSKSLKLGYLWLGEKGFGENLSRAEYVRNYPAVSEAGAEFARLLEAQCGAEGIALTEARVDNIYKTGEEYLLTAGKDSFTARAVILCTGVERTGALAGEREFLGRGVSYCAVCDGALYRGKTVAAVLSDEKFAKEADYLAEFADVVHAFCAKGTPTFQRENVIFHAELPRGIAGGERVERLQLNEGELNVDGVFLLKNSAPPQSLVGGLETEGAHVKVGRDLSTNLDGLFAAGDVTGTPYQFVKAAGEGCVAAFSARDFLRNRLYSAGERSIIEKMFSEDNMQDTIRSAENAPHVIKREERAEGVRLLKLKRRTAPPEPNENTAPAEQVEEPVEQETPIAPIEEPVEPLTQAKPVEAANLAEQIAQAEQARLAAEEARLAAEQARLALEEVRQALAQAKQASEQSEQVKQPKRSDAVIAEMPEDTTLTEDEWLQQEAFRILAIKRRD